MITFLWFLLNPFMPNKHPPKERENIFDSSEQPWFLFASCLH